jgi:heme exporter protein D
MNWNNFGDFFAMGGYALYVWGSYFMVFFTLLFESYFVWRRYQNSHIKMQRSLGPQL